MKVAKGEDRIAFVGERFTVKLARSCPIRFGEQAIDLLKRGGVKQAIDSWSRFTPDQHHSLKNLLLHGVAANRRERRLAQGAGNVVVPTVSLLGGIANVQLTAQTLEISHREIHGSFVKNLGSQVTLLGHMLENPANLGIDNGMVKFVDGGSKGLEGLMESRGADVESSLAAVTQRLNIHE